MPAVEGMGLLVPGKGALSPREGIVFAIADVSIIHPSVLPVMVQKC